MEDRIRKLIEPKRHRKGLVILAVAMMIIFFVQALVACTNGDNNWKTNTKLIAENISELKNDDMVVLNEITGFQWDKVYSFGPYYPIEDIQKDIGIEFSGLKETVSEGMDQIIFTKDNQVVCYIYGHAMKNGFTLNFYNNDSTRSYAVLNSSDNSMFNVISSDSEEFVCLEYINITNQLEYVNESLGYTITLPKNIENRIKIGKEGETIYVQSIMIDEQYEGLGIVAFIYPMSKSEYPQRQDIDNFIENESPVSMVVIGETQDNYICYNVATDMQYPPNDKALEKEYRNLKNEIMQSGFGFRALNDNELSKEKGDSYDIEIKGYIKEYDTSTDRLKIDEVEWLTDEDSDRVEELGYDANMDNGFMIYNENQTITEYKVKDEASLKILEYIGSGNGKTTNKEGFLSRMNEWQDINDQGMLVNLKIKNNMVIELREQYTP